MPFYQSRCSTNMIDKAIANRSELPYSDRRKAVRLHTAHYPQNNTSVPFTFSIATAMNFAVRAAQHVGNWARDGNMSDERIAFGVCLPGEDTAPCSAQPKAPPSYVEEVLIGVTTCEVRMNDSNRPNPGTSTQPKAPPTQPKPPPPPPKPSK